MQTVAEMIPDYKKNLDALRARRRELIPDYKKNLDALRARRRELIAERELEPRFERRHALTVRIIRLDGIIASTTAALHDMIAYAD